MAGPHKNPKVLLKLYIPLYIRKKPTPSLLAVVQDTSPFVLSGKTEFKSEMIQN